MEIPERVRRQALHPMSELPLPPGFRRIDRGQFAAYLHHMPVAQVVEPQALVPDEVEAAVEDARDVVRADARPLLIWLVGPGHPWLGRRLEELGLVNEDTPGFESVENAMALVEPPAGTAPDDVEVREVKTFEEYASSSRIGAEVFGVTQEMRDEMEAELPERYEEYTTPGNPMRTLIASLDGRIVGTATAALGDAGVNLFGGTVLADARGRGVYRALTLARWDMAVERGTPALTIQAGRMSRPIAERLGFQFVGAMHVFVDDFSEVECAQSS
jgi:hypothetical protein